MNQGDENAAAMADARTAARIDLAGYGAITVVVVTRPGNVVR